jgi:hypothetical protein
MNPAALDYRLAPDSAGIDAGTSDTVPIVDRDAAFRQDARHVKNKGAGSTTYVDIGAYEFRNPPLPPGVKKPEKAKKKKLVCKTKKQKRTKKCKAKAKRKARARKRKLSCTTKRQKSTHRCKARARAKREAQRRSRPG